MQLPHFSFSAKRSAGFTLIELLVVIAIIAVLAGILFPVLGSVQNSARKAQVASDTRNIKVAIISYYTDYRKYPLNINQQDAVSNIGHDTVYGDPGGTYSSADLFNILRAQADDYFNQNNQLNANQSVYWQGQFAKNPSSPRAGITTADSKDTYGNPVRAGSLVDPWGNPYLVWIDANKDGDLTTAFGWFYFDVTATGSVHPGDAPLGLAFGSLGPDGKFGTEGNNTLAGSDDIVSW